MKLDPTLQHSHDHLQLLSLPVRLAEEIYHFIDQNADNNCVGQFPQEDPLSVPLNAAGKKRQGPRVPIQ